MKRLALAAALLTAVVAVWLLDPEPARADTVLGTCITANVKITHGDWLQLPDAGFRYTVCGNTLLGDGGVAPVVNPCLTCEPGAWNSAPATCVANWKAARCP